MDRVVKGSAVVLMVFVFGCVNIWAQATAQISGTVKDASGAVLPGADITATQTETGISRATVSNETGSYVIPNLPLGPYKIEVALPGFRTFIQAGLVLQVNSNPTINAVLEVGQKAELVEVEANASIVETRSIGVAQVMETQRILELPLNGRNVTELITLGAGATSVPEDASQSRSMQGQVAVAVAGGMPSGVNYSLDGGQHTNPYDHLSLPLPFPDALQEFKIETSALSASQGQHSGAQVSSVTKNGTNDFHGDLFEFVRNDLLNATTYFAAVDPKTGNKVHSTLKRNQFGGTIGGPIVRNRLFFFGGVQDTINHQDPANIQNWIPTDAMLRGDFSAAASAACGKAVTLPAALGFTNNVIDPSKFDPVSLNIVKKLPTTTDPCGLITYGDPSNTSNQQYVGRTDYQLNPAHSIMGRVLITRQFQPSPYSLAPNNLLTSFDHGQGNLAQSYAIGDTWLVSAKTVVSTRLVANYTNVDRLGAHFFTYSDVGVKNYHSNQDQYLQLTVGSPGFSLGSAVGNDSTYRTFSTGLNSDASLTRGAHQLAAGAALLWVDSNSNANVSSSGSFSFTGTVTGFPLADFLLGKSSSFTEAGPNTDYQRKWYVGLYAADTWKLNQRWTLTYGLRWEPDLAETLTLGRITKYSDAARAAGVRSTVFPKAPLGFSFPGDPGFQGKTGRDRNWFEFAPRFGFAWDVRGDGKTSVRASTGIGYDYPNAQYHLWTSIVPPWGGNTTIVNPVFDDPWSTPGAGFNGVDPFPVQFGPSVPFVPNGSYTAISNIKPAQVQNWNLSVQEQVSRDWFVSAAYVGSHTIHMLGDEQLNPAVFFPGNADASGNCFTQNYTFKTTANAVCSTTTNTNNRRVLSLIDLQNTGQYVSNLVQIQSGGTANYNGMLLEVRKRAGKGVTLTTNYTLSHCLAVYQSDEAGNTGANPSIPNPYVGNRNAGRGNCLSDRRQVFNFTPVLTMPTFKNNTLRYAASGWQLATIYRYTTGEFMSIVAGSNNDFARNGTNINAQPALYLGGNPVGDNSGRPLSFWLNKNAYTAPDVGTFGNAGTRTVAAPNHFDFNIAVSRTFHVKERQAFDLRWEVYNVTNSFRPSPTGLPSTDVKNLLFGQIRTSDDPRIMQFALKYSF